MPFTSISFPYSQCCDLLIFLGRKGPADCESLLNGNVQFKEVLQAFRRLERKGTVKPAVIIGEKAFVAFA